MKFEFSCIHDNYIGLQHVYKTIIIDEIFYNIKLLIQYSIKYSTGIANHYYGIDVQFIMLNTTTIDGCAVNQCNTTSGQE